MKVLNLLVSGNPGGIETLCRNMSLKKTKIENIWMFIFSGGIITDEMKKNSQDKVEILNEKKNFIKIIRNITKYCKENNVDVITVHHGGTYINLIYLALKCINKNIKFVRYLHSCFDPSLIEKTKIKMLIYKCLLEKAINKSDLVICVSNSVKDTHIRNLKIKNENLKVVYNGINDAFFQKLPDIAHNNEVKKLIYVGRLEKEKRVDLLIDALQKVKDKFTNIKLLIIGDGSEITNLKEQTIKEGLNHTVEFLGKQINVTKWLDDADIFVHPAICDEAFGISIVEAMARGCIPVAFNKGRNSRNY